METHYCVICGKNVILWKTGEILTSHPCRYEQEWRCICGHHIAAPSQTESTDEERFRAAWNEANRCKT